jgi:N-acetylglucosaminyldiphosphoundecaprenol N-acetyl-beta-D-mannosaminyltransferase
MLSLTPNRDFLMASHSALNNVETVEVGGLPVACLNLDETARMMVAAAQSKRRGTKPLFFTSANGEVIARTRFNSAFAGLMDEADLVSADGQPMVVASRLFTSRPLPERVSTTDLFDRVAAEAERRGATFYFYGAAEEINLAFYDRARRAFPKLRILGRSHGFLEKKALEDKIVEIDKLGPDVLWVALGVPLEQQFFRRWADKLPNVAMIKTAGGLFDFLSGAKRRAPVWMQRCCLEWAYRVWLEPRRLLWRYAITNPVAALLLIADTR